MDVYTLNKNFQQDNVIDAFETLVWTERFSKMGEVVLEVPDTPANRLAIPEGKFLSIPASQEVMIAETRSAENGILKIEGSSLVSIFQSRLIKKSWDNKYGFTSFSGTPGVIANLFVQNFAVPGYPGSLIDFGGFATAETIPNLSVASADTTDLTSIVYPAKHGQLYDSLKEFCESYNLGFRILLTSVTAPSSYTLQFVARAGRDLTSTQSTYPSVKFSSAMDSLMDPKELRSIKGYKNNAYAFAPNVLSTSAIYGVAYARPSDVSLTGFDKRTLLVLADDIQPADVDITTSGGIQALKDLLTQKARNELANNNYVKMVDGEVVPQSMFKYGIDYMLGDIVELVVADGDSSAARISEYIYTQDQDGFKAYPTLSVI